MSSLPRLAHDHLLDAQSHEDRYFRVDAQGSADQNRSNASPFEVYVLDAHATNPLVEPARDPSLNLVLLDEVETLLPSIRVIFYDTDYPGSDSITGLHKLFQEHEFPTVFLSERTLGVTHSFGVREKNTMQEINSIRTEINCYNSWFHFLTKHIIAGGGQQEDAVNAGWITGGFFMSWHRDVSPRPIGEPVHPGSSSRLPHESSQITLICFWSHLDHSLRVRLKEFLSNPLSINAALENPFVLYVVILDELVAIMDTIVWRVIGAFNSIEDKVFHSARGNKRRPALQLDFVTLHELAKYITYLKEGSDAILKTIASMQASHEDLMKSCTIAQGPPPTVFTATKRNLLYTEGLFHSINIRLISVEKRLNNITNLAFNLVTQHDSRAARKNSESMSTIAIMTLIFLPGTAVAAIFSTGFIRMDEEGNLKVSKLFWVFWALTIPVTVCTFICWYYWRRWHFQRMKETVFPSNDKKAMRAQGNYSGA